LPGMTPLPVFFGQEWDRFRAGVVGLDPVQQRLTRQQAIGYDVAPDHPGTITLPGWDSIIKTGPRVETTREDWAAYYAAQRAGTAPALSPEKLQSIGAAITARDAARYSNLPGWAQSYGMIMTAIDNVQDFASTVATLGRLSIWGSSHVLDYLAPGASRELAGLMARAAAREAAATTAAELATLKLTDQAFIAAAARAAGSRVFQRAVLGLGARVALRAVPVLGWIITAGDLLNLANLILSAALPAYALLCDGPRAALAAGIPAVVLKNILCRQIWTNFHLNPFSRAARLAAAKKALGRLPSIANLIEVAQTADNLFGYGLSIGGLYGMVMEALFSATGAAVKPESRLNADPALYSLGLPGLSKAASMSESERWAYQGAARAAQAAVLVQSVHDDLPDELHVLTLTVAVAATSMMYEFFSDWDSDDLLAAMLPRRWSAPDYAHPQSILADEDGAGVLQTVGRWPVPGAPRELAGEEYILHFAPRITSALRSYLEPRRSTLGALYYGAAVNQLVENLWILVGAGADPLKWELTPDSKLLTGMAVDGLVLVPQQPEPPVWSFWQALRLELEQNGGRLLEHENIERAAEIHGVQLIRLLAPDAPVPAEWSSYLAEVRGAGASS
jgi:hypothetical protein